MWIETGNSLIDLSQYKCLFKEDTKYIELIPINITNVSLILYKTTTERDQEFERIKNLLLNSSNDIIPR